MCRACLVILHVVFHPCCAGRGLRLPAQLCGLSTGCRQWGWPWLPDVGCLLADCQQRRLAAHSHLSSVLTLLHVCCPPPALSPLLSLPAPPACVCRAAGVGGGLSDEVADHLRYSKDILKPYLKWSLKDLSDSFFVSKPLAPDEYEALLGKYRDKERADRAARQQQQQANGQQHRDRCALWAEELIRGMQAPNALRVGKAGLPGCSCFDVGPRIHTLHVLVAAQLVPRGVLSEVVSRLCRQPALLVVAAAVAAGRGLCRRPSAAHMGRMMLLLLVGGWTGRAAGGSVCLSGRRATQTG